MHKRFCWAVVIDEDITIEHPWIQSWNQQRNDTAKERKRAAPETNLYCLGQNSYHTLSVGILTQRHPPIPHPSDLLASHSTDEQVDYLLNLNYGLRCGRKRM